jgi:3-deoxy-D-manno-octulosonate 8-phosphate phosphatase (KDO 8-P phosphatase)
VATDDERVAAVVRGFGGTVVMTSPDHPSGTDRLAEVMRAVEADVYVNLQGDEPMVRPGDIDMLIAGMRSDVSVQVGTLCHPIDSDEAGNPNTVKAVLAGNGDALYFSRAAIPHPREALPDLVYMKHVGVYAYRREVLASYSGLMPSKLEEAEKLEQLRLLSAGIRIRVWPVAPTGPGVDTPACLQTVRRLMAAAAGLPHAGAVEPEAPASAPSLKDVRLVITDVDGVMTDGGLYWDETGECVKRFHARDGLGIKLLQGSGVKVAVLSGRDSATLRKRVSDLGMSIAAFGVHDKATACLDLMAQAGVTAAQTVYVGDDSIDLPAFDVCGMSYATADAAPYIKAKATAVLATAGGDGALRELADAVLDAQGKSHVYSTSAGLLAAIAATTAVSLQ